MSNQPAAPRSVDLQAAPGADLSWDDLFATPDEFTATPRSAQPPVSEPAPATPQATPPVDDFLKTATGTVYKTREEAERGYAEKDTAIERLRQYAIEKTGFDPLTNKQVAAQPQPQATAEPVDESFLNNPKRYWDQLLDAAQKGDYNRYAQTQAKYMQEVQDQTLAPFRPVIERLVRQEAIGSVSQANHDIQTWIGSSEYGTFLDTIPGLKSAIEYSERTPELYNQLPELYRVAYLANQGSRLPEIIRQQAVGNPAPNQPTIAPRTTTPQTTMTPGQPTISGSPDEMLRSTEGRKAIISNFQSRGLDGMSFERFLK